MTIKLQQKKGIQIKNSGQCTNFGGLQIVDNRLYTIKTKRNNRVSAISVYQNYPKQKHITHKYKDCLLHGNDMTYYNNQLYIAPCSNFCGLISTQTWEFTRLDCNLHINAIAHYKNNKFFVLCEAGATYKIAIVQHEGSRLIELNSWIVNNTKANQGYTISQGMAYNPNSKSIYVVFTNQDYQSNVILKSGIYTTEPDVIYLSKKATAGKYELEGITFKKDGTMLLGSNLPSGKDSIFISTVTRHYNLKDLKDT